MPQRASGTFAARYEQGIRLRRKTPRETHADLSPAKRDPVAILAAGDRTRVPELVPERYRRMLVSPFTFLRGAAAVMAQDLKHEPTAGISVQACGDCHLMNFGAFDTPEELILFDINDFDETLPGVDFTADLKRLAASVAVAALDAKFSNKRARAAAAAAVAAYRIRMRALAKLSPLEVWHSRIELAREIKHIEDRTLRRRLQAIIARAGKTLEQDDNFPHLVRGSKIADKPPTIYHFKPKADARHRVDADDVFASYRKRLPPERLCLLERYALTDTLSKLLESEVSARSAPSACSPAAMARPCSFSSRKPENPCSNASGRNSTGIPGGGSSKGSGPCRRRATFSWAGQRMPCPAGTSTCVTSRTGGLARSARSSRRTPSSATLACAAARSPEPMRVRPILP